jgi:hypothetical protein
MDTLELIKDTCLFGGTVPKERAEEVRNYLDSLEKELETTKPVNVGLGDVSKRFALGDKVKVIKKECGHGFRINEIVTLIKEDIDDWDAEDKNGKVWAVREHELDAC